MGSAAAMSRKETPGRCAERSTNPADGDEASRSAERDIAMRAYNTNRDTSDRRGSAFLGADSRAAEPRPMLLLNSSTRPGQPRKFVFGTRKPPKVRNGKAEAPAPTESLPALVRWS